MARYSRRRTTRAAPRYGRRASYSRGYGRRAPTRRRSVRRGRSRSASPRTVRIVVQTVGATPVGQSSVSPLRAMF